MEKAQSDHVSGQSKPGPELVSETDAALSQADSYPIQKKALWMALNASLHQSLVLTDCWSPLLGTTFVFRCHGVVCCARLSHPNHQSSFIHLYCDFLIKKHHASVM